MGSFTFRIMWSMRREGGRESRCVLLSLILSYDICLRIISPFLPVVRNTAQDSIFSGWEFLYVTVWLTTWLSRFGGSP